MNLLARPLVMAAVAVLTIAVAGPAHAATVVADWQMNDTGTVMTDSSGHGNNGTLKHVATNGSTFAFQGTPSVVAVPSSASLNPASASFTATARIKFASAPSSAVGDYDLVRKGLSGAAGGYWKMEIVQSGRGNCVFKGSAGSVILSAGPNLANNAWHTLSCTTTGSQLRLTVDGTTYTKTGRIGTIANTKIVTVGAKTLSGGDQYTGQMDRVTLSKG